jgi:hypothetical protein
MFIVRGGRNLKTHQSRRRFSVGLNQLMKLELLEDKTSEEVAAIWLEFHKEKDNLLSAVIPGDKYKTLAKRAQRW